MPQLKRSPSVCKSEEVLSRYSYNEIRYVEEQDMYYNLNHNYRGVALIFNHKYFMNKKIKIRRGTNIDRDRLEDKLTTLGFQVETKNNLTYAGIHKSIQAVANMDHSQNDCLLIAVLSHGDLGLLHAYDTTYSLKKLWCNFTDERCPTLAGKPKLFFIQACRGKLYDQGITLSEHIHVDGSSGMDCNPTHPDFLFAFSTTPGFYSWRNTDNGSWFIQSLCDVLNEYGTDTEILTWLTFVSHRVAVKFETNTSEKKQMPSIHSTLTRLLVFTNNTKKEKIDCCITS